MKLDLSGKSVYYKHTLLALAKQKDVDPNQVKAFLKYADSETGSVSDKDGIIAVSAQDGDISIRRYGNTVEMCLNDPKYGERTVSKEKAIKIAKNEKLAPLLKLLWRHTFSGTHYQICYTSLLQMQHITKEHLTRTEPLYSRGFSHFELPEDWRGENEENGNRKDNRS